MPIGQVIQLVSRELGSFLVEDVPVGGTILPLDSATDFLEGSGALLKIELGATRGYRNRDAEQGLVTLTSALTVALTRGSRVVPFPQGEETWALVSEENGRPTDSIWAIVPYALRGFLLADGYRDADHRERVRYEIVDSRAEVVDVMQRIPTLDPDTIPPKAITSDKIGDYAVAVTQFRSNQHFMI